MKKLLPVLFFAFSFCAVAQQNTTVKEYNKVFTTYPFSDPNPVADGSSLFFPYFRYDGFTDKPIQKEWKVVEIENDFIKIMILPEIGGKIWSAVEKSTGENFIYYNHVVKFRDIAMRGPWTSGGIEANYGIIGHTPACATPVDYKIIHEKDGSVSCIIGVLDLLTRTPWRLIINLPKDKAFITTTSFWFNASGIAQPYYTWMNTGIKAKGNLQYIYPGTHFLGHEGEHGDWPINKKNGKDVSWYENNNFGGYKSYHVFGKYTDFFGAYWHDDDFGMGRYSTHDDKPGKKIWIWGLSQQGMLWEKELTDTDGQYTEVQSGRLFNQTAEKSTFTPFKHRSFAPYETDRWTEYWFPVKQTKGFVKANNYGALNVKKESGWLKIYFSPLQNINDELKIISGQKIIYSKNISLKPMQLFSDSVLVNSEAENVVVSIGGDKLVYNSSPGEGVLNRPLDSPTDFDWGSVQGLYIQGKENLDERNYAAAEIKMKECLTKDDNYLPALNGMAILMLHKLECNEALDFAKKALSIDTYDADANYYYGIINNLLKNFTDAKDGFDIASQDVGYRSAAFSRLAKLYLVQKDNDKAIAYAQKSLLYNTINLESMQVLAVAYRYQNNSEKAKPLLEKMLDVDPLNHFALMEQSLWQNDDNSKEIFINSIKSEIPEQQFLELAAWYFTAADTLTALKVLQGSPQTSEVLYWLSYLKKDPSLAAKALQNQDVLFLPPFREETLTVLDIRNLKNWKAKYYAGLIYWGHNNIAKAKELLLSCGDEPTNAAFYASRAKLFIADTAQYYLDVQHAMQLNNNEWRYGKMLIDYYISHHDIQRALVTSKIYAGKFPQNYIIGMLYIKALQANANYSQAAKLLDKINILPYEGSTDGRLLYKENHLLTAVAFMKKNNYKTAIKEIEKAKQWPENLGVGKPYQDQIDDRLENWMLYKCYSALSNSSAANEALQHIIQFVPTVDNTVMNFLPANHLITAWAIEKTGGVDKAKEWLQQEAAKYPDDNSIQWALQVYNKNTVTAARDTKDATQAIIEALMALPKN
jgi:lipopolysaccharide biosynthesis regulator YciM